MNKFFTTLSMAMLIGLSACKDMPTQTEPLKIGLIADADPSSYCSFLPKGHEFVFDTPSTWQWVFLTPFPDFLTDALIKLDGKVRKFKLSKTEKTDTGETRLYKSENGGDVEVEVTMITKRSGYENTSYTGSIRVVSPVIGEPTEFNGDCGV